jgi:hypothetical protein
MKVYRTTQHWYTPKVFFSNSTIHHLNLYVLLKCDVVRFVVIISVCFYFLLKKNFMCFFSKENEQNPLQRRNRKHHKHKGGTHPSHHAQSSTT